MKTGEEKSFNLGTSDKEKCLYEDIDLYMKASQKSNKWDDKVLEFRGNYGDKAQLVNMDVKPSEVADIVYQCDKTYHADIVVHA